MNFSQFLDVIGDRLKGVGAKIAQRQESAATGGATWWISFIRAGCHYRLKFDSHASKLTLEREQGSFVPNSPATWRLLETLPADGAELEAALPLVDELLRRFVPPR